MTTLHKITFNVATTVGFFVSVASAQIGNDNPTGTSGQYNGNVTTGCSYDPYTANATRSVTDLTIAGGVGSYPLAFTRTVNSRYTPGVRTELGTAGNWTHSFQWSIEPVTVTSQGKVGRPASYTVHYPDGRTVNFSSQNSDWAFRGQSGVRDRLYKLWNQSPNDCFLVMPDNTRIHFSATISTTPASGGSKTWYTSTYTFSLTEIIDPYMQATKITYPGDGSMTVTEPAGRTIKVFYRNISDQNQGAVGDRVADRIVGSDARIVRYNYTAYVTANGTRYTALSSVRYFDDPTYDASYGYQRDNVDLNGRPLIASCIDPMFDGPMWKIAYDFAPSASGVVSGQLLREKHPNGHTGFYSHYREHREPKCSD